MRLFKFKRFWLILLLPLSAGLLRLASKYPQYVERFYTRGLYRGLSGTIGRFTSLFPFSVSTSLVFLAVGGFLVWLIRKGIQFRRAPVKVLRDRKRLNFSRGIATFCGVAGSLYFIFVLFCGLNYQRLTFAEQSGLEVHPSSAEELAALCTDLVEEANTLRAQLPEDETGVMTLQTPVHQLAKQARALYPSVAEEYPVLAGYVARPKPTLFSRGMSWLNITGIYISFTFEANVNVDVLDYTIPATMMHEMSHSKGYMREDEANFIAYLTCKYSGNPVFQYSGVMLALSHSGNALYKADSDLYYEVMENLSDQVRADRAANNAYWKQFEGPVAEVSTTVNDVYLKSNLQQSGVKSYGEMVDLLLAEFRRG